MGYGNFVKMPTLGELREALLYAPDIRQPPLKCLTAFEKCRVGERLGVKRGNVWLVQIGGKPTYLFNLVWRVVEGSIPNGYRVEQIDDSDDNRIINLQLVNRSGGVRCPKTKVDTPPSSQC